MPRERLAIYIFLMVATFLICPASAEPVKLRVAEAHAHAGSDGYVYIFLTEESQAALSRFTKDRVGKMMQLTIGKRIMQSRLRTVLVARQMDIGLKDLSLQEAKELEEGLYSGNLPFEYDDLPN